MSPETSSHIKYLNIVQGLFACLLSPSRSLAFPGALSTCAGLSLNIVCVRANTHTHTVHTQLVPCQPHNSQVYLIDNLLPPPQVIYTIMAPKKLSRNHALWLIEVTLK